MTVIRLTHVADLPTPEDLVRRLKDETPPPAAPTNPPSGGAPAPGGGSDMSAGARTVQSAALRPSGSGGSPSAARAQDPEAALAHFPTFNHVVELIRANRDGKLLMDVEADLRLVSYQPGRITFEPSPTAPADLAQRLGSALQRWSGNRWAVSVVSEGGAPSIQEVRNAEEDTLKSEALDHPLVQAVFTAFPKAKIKTIRSAAALAAEAQVDALQEVEDEWDPFEED
jgi:DNA polymerase-3 subunit gamma/tau